MRVVACVGGVVLAIPVLILVALGLGASYSPSGWLMLMGVAVVVVGMITTPWRPSVAGGSFARASPSFPCSSSGG